MIDNQPLLLSAEELPQTDEPKRKEQINCLQDMLLELMNERSVTLAQIHRETGIKWGTLFGWYKGDVSTQLADKNLLALAKFFNVTLEYLVYGIGDSEPAFEQFNNEAS